MIGSAPSPGLQMNVLGISWTSARRGPLPLESHGGRRRRRPLRATGARRQWTSGYKSGRPHRRPLSRALLQRRGWRRICASSSTGLAVNRSGLIVGAQLTRVLGHAERYTHRVNVMTNVFRNCSIADQFSRRLSGSTPINRSRSCLRRHRESATCSNGAARASPCRNIRHCVSKFVRASVRL